MRKILVTLAAVVCCAMILSVFTAYGNKEESATSETSKDSTAVVINLDSIIIKPYLAFGATLTDVEKYMTENFADFDIVNANTLIRIDEDGDTCYGRYYNKGYRQIRFRFSYDDGNDFFYCAYDYFSPIPLESVISELKRNGFVNKGEVKFEDYNADICYLFLSANETIEVLLSSWKKDGGSWSISFQPTDMNDLNHLIIK